MKIGFTGIAALILSCLLSVFCVVQVEAGGWTSERVNDISRVQSEIVLVKEAVTVSSTGNFAQIALSAVSEDDIITTGTPAGVRTFTVKYTDNTTTDTGVTKIRIDGRNQFGGVSSETFTFTGSGTDTAIGKVPFAARPIPTITIVELDTDAVADVIDIYRAGFGLKSCPKSADDVLSEIVDTGSAWTEQTSAEGWTFASRYDTTFSVYRNTGLSAAGSRVWFSFVTSAREPRGVGPGTSELEGPRFFNSITGE